MERNPMQPKIQTFKLSQIKPAEYNPRIISDDAMAGLTASIKRFGYIEPMVINTYRNKNTIVGGNQRYRILLGLYGEDHKCICITVKLNPVEEKTLNLTLNNPHIQGQFIK